ncbi:MAG: hypothetical protein GY757_07105 [bacterium]|nr:hypothetical protein [bacterium]
MAGKPAAIVGFTTVAGIPKEVFYPIFFTFQELGFDTIRFEGIPGGVPGLSYCKAEDNEDQLLEALADSYKEKVERSA